MAEFQEVMRQIARLCRNTPCSDDCPLDDDCACRTIANCACENHSERIERKVMAWAAEHPEPVYPTWWEWLENMGIVGKAKSEHSEIFDTICVETRMFDPIPADIAQKLGIEPILSRKE